MLDLIQYHQQSVLFSKTEDEYIDFNTNFIALNIVFLVSMDDSPNNNEISIK